KLKPSASAANRHSYFVVACLPQRVSAAAQTEGSQWRGSEIGVRQAGVFSWRKYPGSFRRGKPWRSPVHGGIRRGLSKRDARDAIRTYGVRFGGESCAGSLSRPAMSWGVRRDR